MACRREKHLGTVPPNAPAPDKNGKFLSSSEFVWNRWGLTLWRRTLSNSQRRNYIKAVLCLHEKPSTFGANITGLRSRYDEFQYLHIKQTYLIHFNVRRPLFSSIWNQEKFYLWRRVLLTRSAKAPFLGWHRWFIRTFEKALQEECGYQGSLP